MLFYKGYVKCEGKEAREPFKGKTSDELRRLEQTKGIDYAGVLAENTVMVDIDDMDMADTLQAIIEGEGIKCKVIQTDNGKHFLFRNDGRVVKCFTKENLAVGLKADLKGGFTDSYEALRVWGKDRTVLIDCDEPDQIPKWLLPVKTKKVLYGMTEGDGRNDLIHSYILVLQGLGWSDDEVRECLDIINRYVFDEPMEDDEFDTATRDEAFEKGRAEAFWQDGKFQHHVFGEWMMNEYCIKRIFDNLYLYKDGVYVLARRYMANRIRRKCPTLKRNQVNEVMSYIEDTICENTSVSPPRYIAFKNGIYDLNKDRLLPFNPDIVITNQIPHNYNPDAYSEVLDHMMDKISVNDHEVRTVMEEMIGRCFYRKAIFRASFWCTGDKRNGKSTFMEMLENILGEENTSSTDPSEMGDKFVTVEMMNKLANVCDDIGDTYIRDTKMVKKIITGNTVSAEFKGKDRFKYKPTLANIFTMNEIARMKDSGGAMTDRMVRVPFDATFSPDDDDFDPDIGEKLEDEEVMEYAIILGLTALKGVLKRKSFTVPQKCVDALKEYRLENDTVLQFFEDVPREEVVNHSVNELFLRYTAFCTEGAYEAKGKTNFTKRVQDEYKVESQPRKINGKSERIFISKQ